MFKSKVNDQLVEAWQVGPTEAPEWATQATKRNIHGQLVITGVDKIVPEGKYLVNSSNGVSFMDEEHFKAMFDEIKEELDQEIKEESLYLDEK